MFSFRKTRPEPDADADAVAQALPDEPREPRPRGLSLFWRTFALLLVLLVGSALAWVQTLRELDLAPRALQTARHIASLVNLSRAAVAHSDAIAQVSLFKTLLDQEHLAIRPREPKDQHEPLPDTDANRQVREQILRRVGPDTLVAGRVNAVEGLWVGFTIGADRYWLHTERSRLDQPSRGAWLIWLLAVTALSLAGAAGMARLINRPLKDLWRAARRVHEGDFQPTALDERVGTQEIRAVNVGFNRMTRRLAQVEQDRTVMLAGISHDLRTPLARLRLEAELSVPDPQARQAMASDIDQLDAIIGKFLDYARPHEFRLGPLPLKDALQTCLEPFRKRSDLVLKVALQDGLVVLAEAVELQRVLVNLIENAARYGRTPGSEQTCLDISARQRERQVHLRLRDHGPGVAPDQLLQLTTPFYRGEQARTAANGTGLGLAIVAQTIARMGGRFDLSNAQSGGLCADIRLQRADLDAT